MCHNTVAPDKMTFNPAQLPGARECVAQAQTVDSFQNVIRSQCEHFGRDFTRAPNIASGPYRSIGIDNQQRCQYDLTRIRDLLSTTTSIVQIIGDSGTAFDDDKIPAAQTILSSHVANSAIEYGWTASKHDTNWLVNDYKAEYPQTMLIANLVEQSAEALDKGMEGIQNVSTFVLLFDRLSPTRFGDDIWLSDGIMRSERGDKMLCFEGGPQALCQCSHVLTKAVQVVAVTNLRSGRFSAARFLTAFKTGFQNAEEYLSEAQATSKQSNIARWCLSVWQDSDVDIASLILPVDVD